MVNSVKVEYKSLLRVVDNINPFLVLLSIVGLFFEYTRFKQYSLVPNQIISILFVVDFGIRLVLFDVKKYPFKGYGWVDFLASLPGFFFFLGNTRFLQFLK